MVFGIILLVASGLLMIFEIVSFVIKIVNRKKQKSSSTLVSNQITVKKEDK